MGLLFTCAGSALPRAAMPALLSMFWTIILEISGLHYHIVHNHGGSEELDPEHWFLNNTYPYQAFAYMVGIALVFRTNVAYARYWEGVTAYKQFCAKWGDSCTFVLSFDRHSLAPDTPKGRDNEATRSTFAALCVHRFSLLHALACAHLRRENFLRPVTRAPAVPSAQNVGPTPISMSVGEGSSGGACSTPSGEAYPAETGAAGVNAGSRTMASMASQPLKGPETPHGGDHAGAGGAGAGAGGAGKLLKALTCWPTLKSFSHSSARYSSYLRDHPLPVLGGLSADETRYLGRLDSETRVNACFAQVVGMINGRRAAGGLGVDAPVLSRVHQELSAGMEGFQQACKLEDTPFPFPYAQVVSFVLAIFAATYPLVALTIASHKGSPVSEWPAAPAAPPYAPASGGLPAGRGDNAPASAGGVGEALWQISWLAPCLAFVTVLTYFAFHEVARELEDPFLHPPNELPVQAMQANFNSRLLATWEALEDMYQPTVLDLPHEGGGSSPPSEAGAPGEGGTRGRTDTALGLHGLRSTDAERLLSDWKANSHGKQAVALQYGPEEGIGSDDGIELASMGGPLNGSARSGASGSARGGGASGGPQRKRPVKVAKSVAHMRKSVYAQNETLQLVSVT